MSDRNIQTVPPHRPPPIPIHVVGAGSSGGAVVEALLREDVATSIHVWDDDYVERENTKVQRPYGPHDVGTQKVYALRSYAEWMRFACEVLPHPERVTAETPLKGIVIACVDSMRSRRSILDAVLASIPDVELYLDTRTGGPDWQLFTFDPSDFEATEEYERRLFPDEDSLQLPCGGKVDRLTPVVLAERVRMHLALYTEGVMPEFFISSDLESTTGQH